MENLFFLLQNSKQFKRQVSILTYLDMMKAGVTATELARVSGCTAPTVRAEIAAIQETYPE